jgi:hypothetical protein
MSARQIITSRSLAATGLAVVGIFVIGLMVALPALQSYNQKVDGQKLAGKVLAVCAQGGDAAAPLVALHACPLAQQVQSATPVVASSPAGLTHDEVQNMINETLARNKAPAPVAPPPTTVPMMLPSEGGGSRGPESPPGVAGQPGREPYQRPAPEEQVRSTEENRPPPYRQDRGRPYQYDYSSQRGEDHNPPERTVTEQAPTPVTVTEQAPPPTAVQAPAPVTQTVEQPQQAPAQNGTPLLNGLGGLLNGLGSGL